MRLLIILLASPLFLFAQEHSEAETHLGSKQGAVVGGLRGRRARRAGDHVEQQQNEQASIAQSQALLDNYVKAFSVCMEGKGYTVK